MADDRAFEDLVQTVARLSQEVATLRSTALTSASRGTTGDIEPTFRATPKPETLLLQGQTVNRADFPALWAWAQANGAVTQEAFGPGNGTTTFTLPDMQGVVPIGVGTGQGGTYVLGDISGAATRSITTSNMPSHTHGIFNDGDHTGHHTGSFNAGAGGTAVALFVPSSPGNFANNTGATASTGSGSAFDVRQPTIGLNWIVWV